MKKISIEGNIATGKSTFVKLLEKTNDDWSVFVEPVARWTNMKDMDNDELTASQEHGGNLLEMFYQDISRWSYTFQSYSLLSKMRLIQGVPATQNENRVYFFERSLQSDRHVFGKNCFESGMMTEGEWDTFRDWNNYFVTTMPDLKLDGIVYLRAEPELCCKRMHKRARPEEAAVSLGYLRSLHEKHEQWLFADQQRTGLSSDGCKVLTVDCNLEFADDVSLQAKMIDDVKTFVESL